MNLVLSLLFLVDEGGIYHKPQSNATRIPIKTGDAMGW